MSRILLFVFLVLGLIVAIYLVGHRTNILPKADNLSIPNLSFSPEGGTFSRGCNFSKTVNVDTAGFFTDGTDAVVKFDPKKLFVSSVANGLIYQNYPESRVDNNLGTIKISGLASSSPYQGSGVLATVNFSVKQEAGLGSTNLSFDFDPNNTSKTTDSNIVEHGTVREILGSVSSTTIMIGEGVSCNSASPIATAVSITAKLAGQNDRSVIVTWSGVSEPTIYDRIVLLSGESNKVGFYKNYTNWKYTSNCATTDPVGANVKSSGSCTFEIPSAGQYQFSLQKSLSISNTVSAFNFKAVSSPR